MNIRIIGFSLITGLALFMLAGCGEVGDEASGGIPAQSPGMATAFQSVETADGETPRPQLLPDTVITSSPEAISFSPVATFEFICCKPGHHGLNNQVCVPDDNCLFQCRLDDGDWEDCVSPQNYSWLAAGAHTFQVLSFSDRKSRSLTPATFSWYQSAIFIRHKTYKTYHCWENVIHCVYY